MRSGRADVAGADGNRTGTPRGDRRGPCRPGARSGGPPRHGDPHRDRCPGAAHGRMPSCRSSRRRRWAPMARDRPAGPRRNRTAAGGDPTSTTRSRRAAPSGRRAATSPTGTRIIEAGDGPDAGRRRRFAGVGLDRRPGPSSADGRGSSRRGTRSARPDRHSAQRASPTPTVRAWSRWSSGRWRPTRARDRRGRSTMPRPAVRGPRGRGRRDHRLGRGLGRAVRRRRAAFENVGTIDLWRVAVQPGKPFAFGTARAPGTWRRSAGRSLVRAARATRSRASSRSSCSCGRPSAAWPDATTSSDRVDRAVLDRSRVQEPRPARLRPRRGRAGCDGAPVRDDHGRVRVSLAGGAGGQGSHVLSALAHGRCARGHPRGWPALPAGADVALWWLDRS